MDLALHECRFLVLCLAVNLGSNQSGSDSVQHGVVRILQSFQDQANLCLMFTSRYLPEIERQFTGSPTLPIRATEADVRCFLDGEVHRLPRCVQRDTELQDLVKAKVAAAVDGM
jgi:hypothetical protein